MNNLRENDNLNNVVEINKSDKKNKAINKPLLVGGIYFFSVLLFILFKILALVGIFDSLDYAWQETISSCIIQIFIIFAIPFALYCIFTRQKIKDTAKEFRIRSISFKSILFSIIIGFGVYFLIAYTSGVFSAILTYFGAEGVPTSEPINYSHFTVPMFFLTVLLSAILPAICEEFLHRGMLLGTSSKYGVKFAIVTSSLAFGFLHMNINQCFYAVLIGLFLGYLCIYTRSIVPCIIIHFMNNFLNVFFDFCYVNNWIGGGYYGWQNFIGQYLGNEGLYLLGVLLFVASLVLVVFFSYKLIKKERLDKEIENMPEDFVDEYETIKQQAQQFPTISPMYEKTKSKLSYFLYYTQKKAKEQSTNRLNYLEQPNGNMKFKWYDNIFLYSSIAVAIFYCLISFLSIWI